jgi:dipeptidyl aminopeptidase/acylaminoacyl peptidase
VTQSRGVGAVDRRSAPVEELRRGRGRQLGHRVAIPVGDPDVGAVGRDRVRAPELVGSAEDGLTSSGLVVRRQCDVKDSTDMARRGLKPRDVGILRWASDAQISPDGEQVAWVEAGLDLDADRPVTSVVVAPSAGGAPRRFTEGPRDGAPRWSPDGRYLAYMSVVDDRPAVHLAPLAGGVPVKVDTPGPVTFLSWSPSGESLVLVVALTPTSAPRDDPKAKNAGKLVRGMANRLDGRGFLAGRDHLFIYTVGDRSLRRLTSGEYDHAYPCWSPDGRKVAYFSDRSRRRDDEVAFADLWVIATAGGRRTKVAARVAQGADPSFSPDGKLIAFVGVVNPKRPVAGRDASVFVVPSDGSGQPMQVAPDLDRPVAVRMPASSCAWLTSRELLFKIADRGTVSIQQAKIGDRLARPVLTGDLQVTSVSVAKRRGTRQAVFTAGWVDKPGEVFSLDLEAGRRRTRQLSDAGKDLLDAVDLLPAKRLVAKARDGKPIEYFIISPKAGRGAPPMFLDIHGGPNSSHPAVSLLASCQALAAAGYAVVLPNPRGSTGYGEGFATEVTGDWGGEDYYDLLACADDVIRRGLGDENRQFVGGYSYGGYMSAWVIGHTDRFRAACVGAPVIDLVAEFGASDVGMWIPDTTGADPWHPDGPLRQRSPLTHLPNVNTPVFLYVFEGDLRCPTDQADALFNGLRWLGKEVEYVRYPGGSHASFDVLGAPPSQSEDRLNRILGFLSRHGGVKATRLAGATRSA